MDILCDPEGLVHNPQNSEITDSKDPLALFKDGQFLATVKATLELIPQCKDDASVSRVLDYWYVRIQSLLILQIGHQAAEEIAHNLGPLDSEEFTIESLNASEDRYRAWQLKLLLVPVKTKGINQAAIQRYYILASSARQEAADTEDPDLRQLWLGGVQRAGLYVLSTLVALRDYTTAIQLLKAHGDATNFPSVAQSLALLHIMIGDTFGAQAWLAKIEDTDAAQEIRDLIKFADDDIEDGLKSSNVSGVASLYLGKVFEGIEQLEQKVLSEHTKSGDANTVTISNLFTLYDLCFTDAKTRKAHLAVALRGSKPGTVESPKDVAA